nr:MAG TPA: hypothetical protein [Caudoviricetes sp.]
MSFFIYKSKLSYHFFLQLRIKKEQFKTALLSYF